MPRPKLKRKLTIRVNDKNFIPEGSLIDNTDVNFGQNNVVLFKEEYVAMQWVDRKGLSQTAAAVKMDTSQSTLQRILSSARTKVALFLNGDKRMIIE